MENNVTFVGFVANEPALKEVAYTNKQGEEIKTQVATVTVGQNVSYSDKDKEYFDISFWGHQAENVVNVCKPGDNIVIDCRVSKDRSNNLTLIGESFRNFDYTKNRNKDTAKDVENDVQEETLSEVENPTEDMTI